MTWGRALELGPLVTLIWNGRMESVYATEAIEIARKQHIDGEQIPSLYIVWPDGVNARDYDQSYVPWCPPTPDAAGEIGWL